MFAKVIFSLDFFFQFSDKTQIFVHKNGLNEEIIIKYVILLNEVIASKG